MKSCANERFICVTQKSPQLSNSLALFVKKLFFADASSIPTINMISSPAPGVAQSLFNHHYIRAITADCSPGGHYEEVEPVPALGEVGALPVHAHRHHLDQHLHQEVGVDDVISHLRHGQSEAK